MSRSHLDVGSTPRPSFQLPRRQADGYGRSSIGRPDVHRPDRRATGTMLPQERDTFVKLFTGMGRGSSDDLSSSSPGSMPSFGMGSSGGGGAAADLSRSARSRDAELKNRLKEIAGSRWMIQNQYTSAMREGRASSISTEELEAGRSRANEEMDMCSTEPELWAWAEENIWKGSQSLVDPEPSSSTAPSPEGGEEAADLMAPPYGIKTPYYATVLVDLLIVMRDTFLNPSAALAVYERTKALGVAPFVIGCSAYMYREVIRTRWLCLHDLKGVLDAVQEARRVGVLSARKRGGASSGGGAEASSSSDFLPGGFGAGPSARLRGEEMPLRKLIDEICGQAQREAATSMSSGSGFGGGGGGGGLSGGSGGDSLFSLSFGRDARADRLRMDFAAQATLVLVGEIEKAIGLDPDYAPNASLASPEDAVYQPRAGSVRVRSGGDRYMRL